jgi:hypothetical protein
MDAFIASITLFPGLIPSALLGVLLIFWLLSIVGVLDLDHIGPDWLGDFHSEGPDSSGHSGGHDDAHGTPDMLVALGFDRLPFSIVISSIVFFWWVLTILLQQHVLPSLPGAAGGLSWITGSVALFMCLALALPIAGRCVRPLKPIFAIQGGLARKLDLIGSVCKVTTSNVDEKFGQAEVRTEGSPIVVAVYATAPNDLVRGSSALILSFDEVRQRYEVEAYEAKSLN